MQRTLTDELETKVGEKVRLKGWLHTLRSLGKLSFLILRDRKGVAQIVVQDKAVLEKLKPLHPGSLLTVEGTVAKTQKIEIQDPSIQVEVPILEAPPIEYYKPEIPTDLEVILDHRAISLRNEKIQAVFRIQAELVHAYHEYMYHTVQATEYFSPNLLGSSSEGGAEFFHVDYFGYPGTLAQSSQLYKQIMVGVNERVFALMPFFRAEPSQTTRHISEGKQFEFEMGFFDHWHEIMDIQEGCIKHLFKHLNTHCSTALKLLRNPLLLAPEEISFPRLSFQEAQELYFERTGKDDRNEPDLSPAAERDLCAWAKEAKGTDFIFITDWPTKKRPFYAFPNEKDPSITNTFDLLAGGVEIASGGQRRHTPASMLEGLKSKEMDPKAFTDYLSVFESGMPPHGGFGMGLERLTMTALRLKNIREASLFPSDTKRIASTRIKAHVFFGGENIRNEILRLIRAQGYSYKHIEHPETLTSEEAAKVRNTSLDSGIKALILRGKKTQKNYLFCIPANGKLNMKKVQELTQEKCEFEKKEVILERFGLSVGAIPPFGNLLNFDTFFDESIQDLPEIAFNCGLTTESICMLPKDLLSVVHPTLSNLTS